MATIFDSVIVGFDRSEQAMDALTLGRLLGSLESRDITVAHVVGTQPPFVARTHEYAQERREKVRNVLEPALSGPRTASVCSRRRSTRAHRRGVSTSWRRARQIRSDGARDRVHAPWPGRSRAAGQCWRAVVLGSALCGDRRAARVCEQDPSALTDVVVGFDGSPESRGALHIGHALAHAAGAGLRVVAVLHHSIFHRHDTGGALEDGGALRVRLDEAVSELAATSKRPSSRAIRSISSPRRRKGRACWCSVDAAMGRCTTCWRAVSRRSSCAARPAQCWSCPVRSASPVWQKRARQNASVLGSTS